MYGDIDRRPVDKYIALVTVLVGLGTFLDGYDLLNISVAMPFLTNTFHLSPEMQGLLGTIVFLGGMVGALAFGAYSDIMGRKSALIVDLVFFLIASALSAFAGSALQLLVLRALIGFGIGADIASGPVLLSEISPKASRGLLLGISLLMMPLGGLVSALVALLAFTARMPADMIWRLLLGLGALPATAVIAVRLFVPESPRWLALKGKNAALESVKKKLMIVSVPGQKTAKFRAPMVIYSAAVWAAAGAMAMFTIFTPIILQKLGELGYMSMLRLTTIIWTFAVLGSLASAVLQDRIGRKPIGAFGMAMLCASMIVLGVSYRLGGGAFLLSIISLAMLSSFLAVGSAYTLQSEVNPTGLRGSLGGVSFAANRLVSFAVGVYTPVALAMGKLGLLLFLVSAIIFVLLVLYVAVGVETKGLALEEITSNG